ncbi:hypothetical protein HBI23_171070 [Parastagonospora nodorum]|nr:hypothetical protein HBI79_154280 [Parastagonospora nodorum]KAH5237947.1 hypothetical protein HBI71_237590 [Parastagonospora nodorum]KAH5398897.1 hypothetical protein HBI47_204580 [Parastagonospora nodorum]KAH5650791.1 hypothetical protein HBI23_171070 [Parastagonospora nodorum]
MRTTSDNLTVVICGRRDAIIEMLSPSPSTTATVGVGRRSYVTLHMIKIWPCRNWTFASCTHFYIIAALFFGEYLHGCIPTLSSSVLPKSYIRGICIRLWFTQGIIALSGPLEKTQVIPRLGMRL